MEAGWLSRKISERLFHLYDRLHAVTDGAVDPLVGRDLELLGYDRTYSKLQPASEAVRVEAHARERSGVAQDVVRHGTTLVTRRPLVIDVGAAGKGYLVEIIAEILREWILHGIRRRWQRRSPPFRCGWNSGSGLSIHLKPSL